MVIIWHSTAQAGTKSLSLGEVTNRILLHESITFGTWMAPLGREDRTIAFMQRSSCITPNDGESRTLLVGTKSHALLGTHRER